MSVTSHFILLWFGQQVLSLWGVLHCELEVISYHQAVDPINGQKICLINTLGHSLIFLVCGNLSNLWCVVGTFRLEISAMFWANNYITSKWQIYPITSLKKFTTWRAPHLLLHILNTSFSVVLLNRLRIKWVKTAIL